MADNRSTSFKIKASSPIEKIEGSSFKKRRTIDGPRPLMNIEYVRVNKIDDEFDKEEVDYEFYQDIIKKGYIIDNDKKTTLLYGTVIVTDLSGDDVIYQRSQGCTGTMITDEYISLVGPSRPIYSPDKFIIRVGLWVRVWVRFCRKGTINDDLEIPIDKVIAEGEIEWDLRTRDQSAYGKPVQEDVSGKRGSVSVGYSVIREALSVTVKVVMMTGSIPELYGAIQAWTFLGGLSTPRKLFYRTRDDPWGGGDPSIHLTRPIFAVAVGFDLTIEVNLWKREGDLSPDSQIVMGDVIFTPTLGLQTQHIAAKDYGRVQVYITCE